MRKENGFMLVTGIIVGILVMLFISFQLQLSNVQRRTVALEQTVTANSQTLGQIVDFINQNTGGAEAAPTE